MALTGVEWGSADRCSVLRCSKRFSRVVTCLSLVALIAFAVGPQIGKAQAPSIAFVQANVVVPQTSQSTVPVPSPQAWRPVQWSAIDHACSAKFPT